MINQANDIVISCDSFHLAVWGIVYLSRNHNYHIVTNEKLSNELQREIIEHEKKHIEKHMPQMTYVITLDMQHSKIEKEAEQARAGSFFSHSNGKNY